jgi:hypothetical protein
MLTSTRGCAEAGQGLKAVEAFNKSFDERRNRATRGSEAQSGLLQQRKRRRTGSIEDPGAKRLNADPRADNQDDAAPTADEDTNANARHAVEGANTQQGLQGIDDSNQDGLPHSQNPRRNSNSGHGYSGTNGYGFQDNLESTENYMTPLTDASMHLRIQSLPILANLVSHQSQCHSFHTFNISQRSPKLTGKLNTVLSNPHESSARKLRRRAHHGHPT